MNKVEQLCDRALMINHGHMVLYGPVRELPPPVTPNTR